MIMLNIFYQQYIALYRDQSTTYQTPMVNQWAGLLDRSRDVVLNKAPQRGQIMMKLEEDKPELMNAIRQEK